MQNHRNTFSDKIPGWETTAKILKEVSENHDVPEDMVLSAMESVLSIVISMVNDVQIDTRWIINPAGFFICMAESGSGKSTVMKSFRKPLRDFEEEIQARGDEDLQFALTLGNFTVPALLNRLGEKRCSIGIFSPDGKVSMNPEFFKCSGYMCQMHSDEPIKVERLYSKSPDIRSSRLSIGIMIQNHIFEGIMDKNMPDFRDIGLASRILFSIPETNPEERVFSDKTKSWDNLDIFYEIMRELLAEYKLLYDNPDLPRKLIKVSEDGRKYIVSLQNEIAKKMQHGQVFSDCKDFGAKLPELLVKVAVLFHRLERFEGDISVQSLKNAFVICMYHGRCFRKLFCKPSQDELDANLLDEDFTRLYRSKGEHVFELSEYRWHGILSQLRTKQRYRRALALLEEQGRISITGTRRKGSPESVNLSPFMTLSYPRGFIDSY